MSLTKISEHKMFGGSYQRHSHLSAINNCEMTFGIYLPAQVIQKKPAQEKVPVVYWLSGLTCTDENFMQKAGAQRVADELGIAIVAPDTSPRGEGVADDENAAYDLGLGAGFYLNATKQPWAAHYQMYSYITEELPTLIELHFSVSDKKAILGHSMGGHGALSIALRNTQNYVSASAFSPIVNPINCPWGQKAFSHYLGEDESHWRQYDTCELLKDTETVLPMLIDQGDDDEFLVEQLLTEKLEHIAETNKIPITIRRQQGFDHSYFFIASFIEDHLRFHHQYLSC